jgi:hypothetical protein
MYCLRPKDNWSVTRVDRRSGLRASQSAADQLAREVLDFVVYLRERRDRADWRDMMDAQPASLAPVWDTPADEVWDDA